MDRRLLGKMGIEVSPIGFGAFKIGRNEGIKYPTDYALPDEREAKRLLNGVLDLGVNLIDTAPAYGMSEERIGRFLAGRRAEFVISTKVGESFDGGRSSYDFTSAAVAASIERSLRRLRTGVLDLVFVHAPGGDVRILEETDVVAALLAARSKGDIRGIGFSGKTVAAARSALQWADALMVEYHVDDVSHAAVMVEAEKRGVGVIVKKALASGRLDPKRAIDHALHHSGVTSVLVGTLCLDHLKEIICYAENALSDPSARGAGKA